MTTYELDTYLTHYDVVVDDESLYLAHHGILGMKHGIRNGPPYPLDQGDHSKKEVAMAEATGTTVGKSSGKGAAENMTWREKRAAKKLQKQRTEQLKKAREAKAAKADEKKRAEEEANRKVEAKRKIIESGDYDTVKQHVNELNDDELRAATERIRLNRSLDSYAPKQVQEAEKTLTDKIVDVSNKAQKISNAATTAIGVYNNFAKIYNSVNGDSGDLPVLGDRQYNSNNKSSQQKKEAKDKMAAEVERLNKVAQIVSTSDAGKILENQSIMTKQELEDATGRIKTVHNIQQASVGDWSWAKPKK